MQAMLAAMARMTAGCRPMRWRGCACPSGAGRRALNSSGGGCEPWAAAVAPCFTCQPTHGFKRLVRGFGRSAAREVGCGTSHEHEMLQTPQQQNLQNLAHHHGEAACRTVS